MTANRHLGTSRQAMVMGLVAATRTGRMAAEAMAEVEEVGATAEKAGEGDDGKESWYMT